MSNRYRPRASIFGLFLFKSSSIHSGLGLPCLSFFWIHLFPCFRHHLCDKRSLLGATFVGEVLLDRLVLVLREKDERASKSLGCARRFLELSCRLLGLGFGRAIIVRKVDLATFFHGRVIVRQGGRFCSERKQMTFVRSSLLQKHQQSDDSDTSSVAASNIGRRCQSLRAGQVVARVRRSSSSMRPRDPSRS